MVSKDDKLSVRRQCALLTLARSNLYYEPNENGSAKVSHGSGVIISLRAT